MAKQPGQPKPTPPGKPPAPVPLPPIPMNPNPAGAGGKSSMPGMNPGGKSAASQNESTRERDLDEAVKKRIQTEDALTKAVTALTDQFGLLGKAVGSVLNLFSKISALSMSQKKSTSGLAGLADLADGWRKDGGKDKNSTGIGGLMGGGLKGAAGKAGMIGALVEASLAVKQVIADLLASPFKLVDGYLQMLGRSAKMLASNDGLGAITNYVDHFADSAKIIPFFGEAMASGVKLVTGSLNMFKGVIDSFAARGKELAQYNPVLASAVAQTEVQKFFADMREANRNEAEYRDLIFAQAKMDRDWQNAITEMKKELIPLATKGAKLLTGLVKYLPAILGQIAGSMAAMGAVVIGPAGVMVALDEINKALADIENNTRPDETDASSVLNDIFDMANQGVRIPDAAPPQFRGAVPPIMNQPFKPKP